MRTETNANYPYCLKQKCSKTDNKPPKRLYNVYCGKTETGKEVQYFKNETATESNSLHVTC